MVRIAKCGGVAVGRSARVAVLVAALSATAATGQTQGFINYRGPTGNGNYPGIGLLKEWPREGLPLAWKYDPGAGWASPSAVDGKLYVAGGRMGQVWVLDFDGKVRQRVYVGSMEWKRFYGSRGVPLVKDGVVATGAPNGNYWGIDLGTGEHRWQVNAWKSFGDGKGGMGWGVPESAMLIDNKVVFNTCSRTNQQPAIVALDIATGKTVWGMKTPKKYSACDVSGSWGIHNGRKLYFHPTFVYLICLDADTGELLWELKEGAPSGIVPAYLDGHLLWGGNNGSLNMMRLSPDGRGYTKLWSRPKSCGGFVQTAFTGNRVFTFSDGFEPATCYDREGNPITNAVDVTATEDGKRGRQLVCLDRDTGKLLQGRPAPHYPGHLIAADGMVYLTELASDGRIVVSLIRPTVQGFDEVSSFRFMPDPCPGTSRTTV